jgi:uncharacterized membrane protein YqiK
MDAMDGSADGLFAIVGAALVVVIVTLLALMSRWVQTAAKGTALIVTGPGESRVVFTRALVVPLLHEVEVLDISTHVLTMERRGRDGLVCRDSIRADVRAAFLVRVNGTAGDVLAAARSVGCARAGDPAALLELFGAKFIEALRTVAHQIDFEALARRRDEFKDQVVEVIGRDLSGFILDDVAIESVEQTPIASLDPSHVLDAEGIRKITEITSQAQVRANELQQQMRIELAHQNLVADQRIARIERERELVSKALEG